MILKDKLKYTIGKLRARVFYIERGIMTAEAFDDTYWDDIANTLKTKPCMYQLWYGKGSGCYRISCKVELHKHLPTNRLRQSPTAIGLWLPESLGSAINDAPQK